jgi:hypothetical protein
LTNCFVNPLLPFRTRIALANQTRTITYAELNERVNRLVQVLACKGVAAGDRVARLPAVTHHAIGGQAHRTGRRKGTAAPVAEPVAVWCDWYRRPGGQMMGTIMSDARVKCMPNTMIMGVGWANS